jgi:LmbE family N-acetylglucosaminyl deacetylase
VPDPRRGSTLHGVAGDLLQLRTAELTAAARILSVGEVELLSYPDARLPDIDLPELAAHAATAARRVHADGIIGFDLNGVTGPPDHAHATAAAVHAAESLEVPVLGGTVPDTVADQLRHEHGAPFDGYPDADIVC